MASDSKKKGESSSGQRLLSIMALGISLVALALTIFVIFNSETSSAYSGQIEAIIRQILPWIKFGFIALLSIGAFTNLMQLNKETR